MSAGTEKTVLITHDYEPDIGSWTRNYSGIREATGPILEVHKRQGVPSTVYFTAEAAKKFPRAVKAFRDAGHEIGCHSLKHESLGPHIWDMAVVEPILESEAKPRIEMATDIVEKLSGVRPVSFRCPRGFSSSAVVQALEELGYRTDSTYMMYHYEEQLAPYHPSARDWTKPGGMKILEIPIFADLTVKEKSRQRDQWPAYRAEGAEKLLEKMERMEQVFAAKGLPQVYTIYFHPWEFVPMPRRYDAGEAVVEFAEFLWKNTGEIALREFERFIALAKDKGFAFCRARDLAEKWS